MSKNKGRGKSAAKRRNQRAELERQETEMRERVMVELRAVANDEADAKADAKISKAQAEIQRIIDEQVESRVNGKFRELVVNDPKFKKAETSKVKKAKQESERLRCELNKLREANKNTAQLYLDIRQTLKLREDDRKLLDALNELGIIKITYCSVPDRHIPAKAGEENVDRMLDGGGLRIRDYADTMERHRAARDADIAERAAAEKAREEGDGDKP